MPPAAGRRDRVMVAVEARAIETRLRPPPENPWVPSRRWSQPLQAQEIPGGRKRHCAEERHRESGELNHSTGTSAMERSAAAREEQDLHVVGEAVHARYPEEVAGDVAAEELEAALRVADAGDREDPHEQVARLRRGRRRYSGCFAAARGPPRAARDPIATGCVGAARRASPIRSGEWRGPRRRRAPDRREDARTPSRRAHPFPRFASWRRIWMRQAQLAPRAAAAIRLASRRRTRRPPGSLPTPSRRARP